MLKAVFVTALLSIVALTILSVGSSSSPSPVTAGGSSVEEFSSKGNGGPNEVSVLRKSCKNGTPVHGGGFFGLDVGSEIVSNGPISKTEWRVAWMNDGSRDIVGIRVKCDGVNPTADYAFFQKSGTGTGSGNTHSLSLQCGVGKVMIGGFYGVDPGTSVIASRPVNETTWRVAWINDGSADTVGVRLLCLDREVTFVLVSQGAMTDGPSSVTAGCPPSASLYGGGFKDLAASTHLAGSRIHNFSNWRLTVESVIPDSYTLLVVCLIG